MSIFNGTFEVDNQFHINWYSGTTARSTADFNTGAAALSTEATAAFGTGITLSNWPYFAIVAGTSYDFSLWHKYTVGATGAVTWNIDWRDEAGALVRNDPVGFTPGTSWAKYGPTSIVAPTGATRLGWTFTFPPPAAGPILWLDDIVVAPTPSAPAGFKANLGNAVSTISGTTLAITTGAAIDVGDLVVIRIASDNLTNTTPTYSAADSGGNTYTQLAQKSQSNTPGAGCTVGLLATVATAAVAAGGTVTVTLSGAVACRAMYVESFTGFTTTIRNQNAGSNLSATASQSGGADQLTGDLVLGVAAIEGNGVPTGDSDTTGGTWSAMNGFVANTGTTATSVEVVGQWKLATGAATANYNTTWTTATDWASAIVVLLPVPSGQTRLARSKVEVLRANTPEGNVRLARAELRVLFSTVAVARDFRVARISTRQLTAGTPGLRMARLSLRSLTPLTIPTAQLARLSTRMLVSLADITPPPPDGATMMVWDGAAWVEVPVWQWDGTEWVALDDIGPAT